MSLVSDQLGKLDPGSGAQQLLGQLKAEKTAQTQQQDADPLAQIDAGMASRDEAQAQLESEHSYLGTIATQGARGLLSGVLGSGALVGAGAEGLGSLTGWDGLKDFGRDLGEGANGKSAMEAAAFLFGGGGKKGLSYAEQAQKTVEDQEKAFPTLSTASQIAGQLALAAAGGEASAASRGTAMIGMNAVGGAGAGAQGAYEQNAPFRDVLTSTLLGVAIGGGVTAGAEALPGLTARFGKSSELEKVFGKSLAEEGAISVEQAGGREARSVMNELDKARKSVAKAVEDAGDNPAIRATARQEAEAAVADQLATKAGKFNPANWAEEAPTALQKVVYRGKILDSVSEDLANDVTKAQSLRPSLDFELSAESLKKLLKNAEGPEAIGGIQGAIKEAIESVPETPAGYEFRRTLSVAQDALDKAPDLTTAMQQSHSLVQQLARLGEDVTDGATKSFADRTRQAFVEQLSSDDWGKAGKLYGSLTSQPSDAFQSLLINQNVRDALRNTEIRGKLPQLLKQEADTVASAIDARAKLSGAVISGTERRALADQLKELEGRFAKGEEAVTLDGGPVGRVVDFFKNRIEDKVVGTLGGGVGAVVGGPAGALLGSVVANAIRPALKDLAPLIRGGAEAVGRYAPSVARRAAVPAAYALTQGEKQEQYNDRLDFLARHSASPDGKVVDQGLSKVQGLPSQMAGIIGADYSSKLTTLLADMPKPKRNIRGKAYETLSSDDLRLANAMWEATTKPLSVFEDFKGGLVDYDKVQYAWKQYPGIKQAAQLGLMDIFTVQMSEPDRAGIPDSILTQLDNLFGMDGSLQPSVDRQFSYHISQMVEPSEEGRPSGRPLDTAAAEPTFTERLAGPS